MCSVNPALIKTILAALCLEGLAVTITAADIGYQFVTVGNPGNAADTTGYGAVGYSYQMGRYDVTLAQYATFLNAVATTDTYGLYNPSMGTDLNIAGIARTPTSSGNGYNYSVIGSGDRPVTYVSLFDAARFANWMQNGQPTGAQNASTTEAGAYTLGRTMGPFDLITKTPGATFYIPTENEWYKAAYYAPALNGGAGGYWKYATQSNILPGNVVGGTANQANYAVWNGSAYVYALTNSVYSSSQNYLTDVGAFSGSASAYGTYDQTGNVFDWNEAVILGSDRGQRGGWWGSSGTLDSSGRSSGNGTNETPFIGFRLASIEPIPEPTGIVTGAFCLGVAALRRKRVSAVQRACTARILETVKRGR